MKHGKWLVVGFLAVAAAMLIPNLVIAGEHPGEPASSGSASAATAEHPGEHPGAPVAGPEAAEFAQPEVVEHPGEHPGAGVAEKPGKKAGEHPGKAAGEHPGEAAEKVTFTADEIRTSIKDHISSEIETQGGSLAVPDPETGNVWNLDFVRVHEDKVSYIKGEDTYFACSDFKTADGTTVDLDFWMKEKDGQLEVVDTKIHKVDGVARYTYVNDEIVEVA